MASRYYVVIIFVIRIQDGRQNRQLGKPVLFASPRDRSIYITLHTDFAIFNAMDILIVVSENIHTASISLKQYNQSINLRFPLLLFRNSSEPISRL